ncbi:MAG: BamA/TamA family outer membrane protein [Candidatus Latescibacterota bacterium]|nr:MAG: BamA/TamA family outer membrane protein [Candidatus Latescibacterota bacterium]
MKSVVARTILSVTIGLICLYSPTHANSLEIDDSRLAWAYGTIVDSITVSGNEGTRAHAVLREMETQPGNVLEEHVIKRDIRFVGDMSPFASVVFSADSLGPGHCAVRIVVEERDEFFLRLILPFLKYDFETGFTYGVRWSDHNFRGRLESVGMTVTQNQRGDENLSLGWSAGWLGWKHIGVGAALSYYHRGDEPAELALVERTGVNSWIAFPLTESRIKFSQITFNVIVDKSLSGGRELEYEKTLSLSPQVGYRFDSRDSHVFPIQGGSFFTAVRATYALDNGRDTHYRFWNRIRHFRHVHKNGVLALLSDLQYQFGDFPDYSVIRLGGPRSLRGHPHGRFEGFHRWFGTIEWRFKFLPRKVLYFPLIKAFDIGFAAVTFIDSGITWYDDESFTINNLHGTAGLGLRFYSPIRDALRFDFGFNGRGDYQFHFGTGIRF